VKTGAPRFSPVGFAVLVVSLFILIRALYIRNAYEIVLALGVLLVWTALFAAGARGARRLADLEPGWKPPSPLGAVPPAAVWGAAFAAGGAVNFAADSAAAFVVTGLDKKTPWFFRLHFVVRGRFFPAAALYGCSVLAETSASRGSGPAPLDLNFPMSGVFEGEGFCRLRDVLGFFSFPCGPVQPRSFPVRSAPCMGKPFRIDAHSGAEDRRNKFAADEERYYMREYAPGDRFRDINWKSSERIDTLITRISPDNQEKVSRVEVYFRNFISGEIPRSAVSGARKFFPRRESLEELWLLDRAKARLAWFLRTVRDGQSSYVFHVRAAQRSWEIKDQDELEAFLDELAGLPFAPSRNEGSGEVRGAAAGELYVFSTACDEGLPAFLLARQTQPVSLFLARPPAPGIPREETEKIRAADFAVNGFTPSLRWLLPSGRKANAGVPQGKGRVFYSYAEAGW
jgi:hypothetical protein